MRTTSRQSSTFTLKDFMIALAIIGLLVVFAIPHFIREREKAKEQAFAKMVARTNVISMRMELREQRRNACIANQRLIENALKDSAHERNLTNGATLPATVVDNLMKVACPEGGKYTIDPTSRQQLVSCSCVWHRPPRNLTAAK